MAKDPIDIQQLINRVEREEPPEEPLARVAAAAQLAEEMSQVGDELVDHFVTTARDAGCSWSSIGASLGVTKQAAQQRFTLSKKWRWPSLPKMKSQRGFFSRFTDKARRAVTEAQNEARGLKHNYIGTEHLLLSIASGEGVAAKVLSAHGVTPEAVRAKILEIVGAGSEEPRGHIPFTPRSKKVLELSLREALRLGHNYIGTEHILLGLVREGEGLAMQILSDLRFPVEATEPTIIAILTGVPGFTAEPPEAS